MSIVVDFSTKQIKSPLKYIDIFKIQGIWGVGSFGNTDSQIVLESFAQNLVHREKYLFLIDMLSLQYKFGDSIISFVVYCLKRRFIFDYLIVASGTTKKNLEKLFDSNGIKMSFIGFSDNVDDGIKKLVGIGGKGS